MRGRAPSFFAGAPMNTPERLRECPVDHATCKEFIGRHHRHNKPPVGWKFCVGLECGRSIGSGTDSSGADAWEWTLVGVAVAGRPVARELDCERAVEITRVCTAGKKNANSRLYGAICRAAKALGYDVAYTYTLQSESGASLRAAGFREDARLNARPTWSCPARQRVQVDLFGEATRPAEAKIRWVRYL